MCDKTLLFLCLFLKSFEIADGRQLSCKPSMECWVESGQEVCSPLKTCYYADADADAEFGKNDVESERDRSLVFQHGERDPCFIPDVDEDDNDKIRDRLLSEIKEEFYVCCDRQKNQGFFWQLFLFGWFLVDNVFFLTSAVFKATILLLLRLNEILFRTSVGRYFVNPFDNQISSFVIWLLKRACYAAWYLEVLRTLLNFIIFLTGVLNDDRNLRYIPRMDELFSQICCEIFPKNRKDSSLEGMQFQNQIRGDARATSLCQQMCEETYGRSKKTREEEEDERLKPQFFVNNQNTIVGVYIDR